MNTLFSCLQSEIEVIPKALANPKAYYFARYQCLIQTTTDFSCKFGSMEHLFHYYSLRSRPLFGWLRPDDNRKRDMCLNYNAGLVTINALRFVNFFEPCEKRIIVSLLLWNYNFLHFDIWIRSTWALRGEISLIFMLSIIEIGLKNNDLANFCINIMYFPVSPAVSFYQVPRACFCS